MKQRSNQHKFYLVAYLLMAAMTLLGLVFNIKTVTLNQEITTLKERIRTLKSENKTYQRIILEKTSLKNIDMNAQQMHLIPIETIKYYSNAE